jgi:hypothetical protein
VTVFNVGPTGDLNLLYPDEQVTASTPPTISGGKRLDVLEVELEPPVGRERLFAVWSRGPMSLTPERIQAVVSGASLPPSGTNQATRNMVNMKNAMQQVRPEDCRVVVLEVDHAPGQQC